MVIFIKFEKGTVSVVFLWVFFIILLLDYKERKIKQLNNCKINCMVQYVVPSQHKVHFRRREFCQSGSIFDNVLFYDGLVDLNSQPAKRHSNGVSLAC